MKTTDSQKQLTDNTKQADSTNQTKQEAQVTDNSNSNTNSNTKWRLVKDYGWNGGDPIEVLGKEGRYFRVKHVVVKDDKPVETVWKVRSSSIEQVAAEAQAVAAAG